MTDKLAVYYKNALKRASSITASPLAKGINPVDLYHPFLSRRTLFTSGDAVITAEWGAGFYIDSVCLADCEFTQARVTVQHDGAVLYDGWHYSRWENSVFALPSALPCDRLTVRIYGALNIGVGWMFAGLRTLFPRFQAAPDTGREVTGNAERTENGQVYGLKRPVLETLSVSFARIDIETRRDMAEFIDAVQYTEPHMVEAYNAEEWPPLYASLTEAGGFKKRDESGFYFDTAMAWTEAG
jgi:hypothetical protein